MLNGMPRPLPDLDTQPFWDACREQRFLVPKCADCGYARWPPGPMCPQCQSTETDWIEASGEGQVYSWVVVTHPVDPILADQVPYVVGLIELAEGARVVGNVDGCDPDEVVAGMDVRLYFGDPGPDGIPIPNFRVADK
jgi:uncharacterized OB-fold protein